VRRRDFQAVSESAAGPQPAEAPAGG
jgi:hypothetical protein